MVKEKDMKIFNTQLVTVLFLIGSLLTNLSVYAWPQKEFNKQPSDRNSANVTKIQLDEYILRLKNEEGEKIDDAWILLEANSVVSDTLKPEPPLLYEYQFKENGLFTTQIKSYKLADKTFTLYVHSDGYEEFELNFTTLRKDITVVLKPKE